MLALSGILIVLCGAVLACSARRLPGYERAIEVAAGLLMIFGLALASGALPVML